MRVPAAAKVLEAACAADPAVRQNEPRLGAFSTKFIGDDAILATLKRSLKYMGRVELEHLLFEDAAFEAFVAVRIGNFVARELVMIDDEFELAAFNCVGSPHEPLLAKLCFGEIAPHRFGRCIQDALEPNGVAT